MTSVQSAAARGAIPAFLGVAFCTGGATAQPARAAPDLATWFTGLTAVSGYEQTFAIVLEGVLEPIAIEATQAVACPTIGIGASAQCDGQVLVTEDMLGMFERVPRFVKKYADIAGVIETTVAQYAEEVRGRSFPTPDQTYQPKS